MRRSIGSIGPNLERSSWSGCWVAMPMSAMLGPRPASAPAVTGWSAYSDGACSAVGIATGAGAVPPGAPGLGARGEDACCCWNSCASPYPPPVMLYCFGPRSVRALWAPGPETGAGCEGVRYPPCSAILGLLLERQQRRGACDQVGCCGLPLLQGCALQDSAVVADHHGDLAQLRDELRHQVSSPHSVQASSHVSLYRSHAGHQRSSC